MAFFSKALAFLIALGISFCTSNGQETITLARSFKAGEVDKYRSKMTVTVNGAEVVVRDFKAAVQEAQAGDFVYFDPPYYPLSATANFTSYAKDDFGVDQQQALAQVFHDLHVRGCRVMLSNSDTPLIRALYRDFRIETVYARRLINSRAEKRGPISEVVVLNYDW
jgi:DNA adenine methylase